MPSQSERQSAIKWAAALVRRMHLRATPESKVRPLPVADGGPVSWSTMAEDDYCTVPPTGWWCSREPGHEGPCAARRIGDPIEDWEAGDPSSLLSDIAAAGSPYPPGEAPTLDELLSEAHDD